MHLLAACILTLYAVIITIAAEVVVHEHALTGNQQWRFCFLTIDIIILLFGLFLCLISIVSTIVHYMKHLNYFNL